MEIDIKRTRYMEIDVLVEIECDFIYLFKIRDNGFNICTIHSCEREEKNYMPQEVIEKLKIS
jgi:hypothetical protein